jgi:uncharacterized protein YggT (Ycf19 family)
MVVYVTADPRTKPLFRLTQIVWYILDVIEVLLGLRFIMRLLGANPAGFTNFIYNVTAPLTEPFRAVFGVSRVAGATFEWTTLLAMAIYWLLAWAIVRALTMSRPVSSYEASEQLTKQDINSS